LFRQAILLGIRPRVCHRKACRLPRVWLPEWRVWLLPHPAGRGRDSRRVQNASGVCGCYLTRPDADGTAGGCRMLLECYWNAIGMLLECYWNALLGSGLPASQHSASVSTQGQTGAHRPPTASTHLRNPRCTLPRCATSLWKGREKGERTLKLEAADEKSEVGSRNAV
jgi:hypothetical protein